MRRWLRMVGEGLGRRTALTLVVAALLTGVLAWGVARLDFATGQDSYLGASSDIAEDNERYQSLFGGESMIVLFTMAPGRTVVDLSARPTARPA